MLGYLFAREHWEKVMAEEFKPGDVVVLKSGGPAMTIRELQGTGTALCEWFNRDDDTFHVERTAFHLETLRLKEDDE